MKTTLTLLFGFFSFLLDAQVVDTTALVKEMDSLSQVLNTLINSRRFQEALDLSEAAQAKVLAALGDQHVLFGRCRHNNGVVLRSMARLQEAEISFKAALPIRQQFFGRNHAAVGATIFELAEVYLRLGKYDEAEPLFLEALTIREKAFGKKHVNYVAVLNDLAGLYQLKGQYADAERYYLETIEIRESLTGKAEPYYAGSLINLGILYEKMGRFEASEPLYLEAKRIFEQDLKNTEHDFYINCLNNLANLYWRQSRFEAAEAFHRQALVVFENVYGQERPEYARHLGGLAMVYRTLGRYEEAELLLLQAVSIVEKKLGAGHPEVAGYLTSLAILYQNMGQYPAAESSYRRILAIREKTVGKLHPDYANALQNLATLYTDMYRYEAAEQLLLEASRVFEKAVGTQHPDYATCLLSLGSLYVKLQRYPEAETLFLKNKTILENTTGKETPDYALNLYNLGVLYGQTGRTESAEATLLEARAFTKTILGEQHARYIQCLIGLADFYSRQGRFEKAEPFYLETSVLQCDQLVRASRHLSEREMAAYTQLFITHLDKCLSFAGVSTLPDRTVDACAYDNALFYKGFLLTMTNRVRRLAQVDSISAETFDRLRSTHRQLAAEYAKPVAERKQLQDLQAQANTLEKELTRTVSGFGEALRQVRWQDVQATLRSGEVAIEFVRYRLDSPRQHDSILYGALVLLSASPGASGPQFIPLCAEKDLKSLLNIPTPRRLDYVADLYRKPGLPGLQSLYEHLWAPLEPVLQGVKTIYFSPAGLLHQIQFGAITTADGKVLADRYELAALGSTRQLVSQPVFPANASASLYGGIKYDRDSIAPGMPVTDWNRGSGLDRGALEFAWVDSSLRMGVWQYLPETERETRQIEAVLKQAGLQPELKTGFAASEDAFKQLGQNQSSPRILHIATHGFFFPNAASPRLEREGGAEPVFKRSDHPMIRSGLILAGANTMWTTGKPWRPDLEDGVLTAYEISQMNLSGTELVVLSACETGLGDIEGYEGVYGLQRAFKIAGVRYVLMSLWQVPDLQTQQLMTAFYRNWLQSGMPIRGALQAAQRDMRGRGLDPFFWAGFVLVE